MFQPREFVGLVFVLALLVVWAIKSEWVALRGETFLSRDGLELVDDPAAYKMFKPIPRIRLRVDGTANSSPRDLASMHRAWVDSTPVVMEGYVPSEMLKWWDLTGSGADASASRLAQALGSEVVEVLRYASRSQGAQNGDEAEDHRTRLMPVDSVDMLLSEFLNRSHQHPGREWPETPLPGEQFMFKRKVPKGYRAPDSEHPAGTIETYVRAHLPRPSNLWDGVGTLGACTTGEKSSFTFDDPMLRLQTPYFSFPVHFDCYGNVLVQMSAEKRVVVFPREAVRLVAGRAVSHEIFDFPEMLTKQGLELVQTAVLKPGDAVFIPIGYFHTIASALQYDDGTVSKIGVGINFPVMCEAGQGKLSYLRLARQCQQDFTRDFPHRSTELKHKRDYAGATSGRRATVAAQDARLRGGGAGRRRLLAQNASTSQFSFN